MGSWYDRLIGADAQLLLASAQGKCGHVRIRPEFLQRLKERLDWEFTMNALGAPSRRQEVAPSAGRLFNRCLISSMRHGPSFAHRPEAPLTVPHAFDLYPFPPSIE